MVGQKSTKAQSVFFHIFSCLLGFIMVYPLLWLLMSSFKSNDTMFHNAWSLIPEKWAAVTNYLSGFEGVAGIPFWRFFANSAIVTVVSVVGSIFCSLLAAYALSRLKFKGSGFWFGCVVMTMMIPSQVMVVPQYIILKHLGLSDTLVSMTLPWVFGHGFFIFLIAQYMRGIPRDLDEAAMLDGCTRWQIFTKITLPLSKPIVIYTILTSFTAPWVDFIFAKVICRANADQYTVAIGLWRMLEKEYIDSWYTSFAAGAVLISIPIAILFLKLQKYYVNGMAGAVKG